MKRLPIPLAIVAAIVAFLLFSSLVIVGPGERGILLTLGKMSDAVLMPGPHLKIPLIQTVVPMDVRVLKYEESESAASLDLQTVTTKVAINYAVDPKQVANLYQNVGSGQMVVLKVLSPAISNAVKAVTARYNAEDLISKRDEVRAGIAKGIVSAMQSYGIEIRAVNITNFEFTPEYSKAIERKQVAQQRALQANYELQQTKIESQKKVVQAQAEAQATVVAAKAESEAMKLKNQSVTARIIQLNAVNRWDGKLPETLVTGSGQMPLLNVLGGAMRNSGK